MLQRLPQRVRGERKKLAQVARIQARGQLHIPTPDQANDQQVEIDEALAAVGLVAVDAQGNTPSPDLAYLWPCNLPIFNAWQRIQTQWRTGGMGQRTGLDYAGVLAYLRDASGIHPRRQAEIFAGIQAMEFAALDEMDKHKG